MTPNPQIQDGLLAATLLLSENPRQTVPSKNPAPNQGINERNFTAANGLASRLALEPCPVTLYRQRKRLRIRAGLLRGQVLRQYDGAVHLAGLERKSRAGSVL